MVRVLLTGASGFVGHHVAEHILKTTEWEIVTLDRLARTARNGYDRLRDVDAYDHERVRRFTHDLNQPIGEGLRKEIGPLDYVLHIAAESHVDRSITEPVPFVMNNVASALTMLEYARKLPDLNRFVYFSTDEVYGSAPEGKDYREGDRHNPGNPYAASKSAAESIVRSYANTYGVPAIITNGMNFIGERQDPEKFLPLVIKRALSGEKVYIHGTPDKRKAGSRYYIHARNAGAALVFILQETTETLCNYQADVGVFNVVGEREYDNLAFASLVAMATGNELNYEIVDFHSSRPGHDLRYGLDGTKLRRLGYNPPVTIEDSIKRVVEWSLRDENKHWLGL